MIDASDIPPCVLCGSHAHCDCDILALLARTAYKPREIERTGPRSLLQPDDDYTAVTPPNVAAHGQPLTVERGGIAISIRRNTDTTTPTDPTDNDPAADNTDTTTPADAGNNPPHLTAKRRHTTGTRTTTTTGTSTGTGTGIGHLTARRHS